MSLSGSSASRKSIWAITRFARSSSMKVGRKMIRSFNRREKMSNARSPRGVCSITIGTRAIGFSLSQARLGRGALRLALIRLRPDLGVADEQLEGQAVTQPTPQLLEVAALLHHTPDGRQRPLARLGDLLQLGAHVDIGGRDGLACGDRFQQERTPDALLGPGPEVGDQLIVIPRHPVRVEPLLPQARARVLDLVGDVAPDHRVRHREVVLCQDRVDDFLLERPPLVVLAPRLELLPQLGAEPREARELDERRALQEKVVDAVLAEHHFTVPDAMVGRHVAHQIEHARASMRQQGLDPDRVPWDYDKLVTDLRPGAEKGVRRALLLEAIAARESIAPADVDVDAELEKIAQASQRPLPAVRRMMEKSGDLEELRRGLRDRLTLELLVGHAKIRA